jgi:hypothetical protein
MSKLLVLPALVLAALAVAAAAAAKGPDRATITGPGLDEPIAFASSGDPAAGSRFGSFVQDTGFFPALFGQTPDPMLDKRPARELGPRYTVVYRVPGPNNELDRIRQDLYPYAKGGPVTYTPPGQTFFGSDKTRGGWFVASPTLKETLVAAGLPATPPAAGGGSGDDGFVPLDPTAALALAAAARALAGLGAAFLLRRRPRLAATR